MNIVKELRKRADLQQQELADMVGVARPTVSEWETQKKDPSGERLRRLAQIFDVDPLVVLGRGTPEIASDQAGCPRTPQARILASGIDKMPERERERALNLVRLMFDQYADLFDEKEKTADGVDT